MHTKTQLALAVATVYLAAGAGSFFIGRSRGFAEAEGRFVASAEARRMAEGRQAQVAGPHGDSSGVVTTPPGLQERLVQAAAAWRAAGGSEQKRLAIESIGALDPGEIGEAFAFLDSLRDETTLHHDFARHLSRLRAVHEPEAALDWLGKNLPRPDNGAVVKAIVSEWAARDPSQAFAWWKHRMDALDFPALEREIENLPELICQTWARHDPEGLVREINEAPADDPRSELLQSGLAQALNEPASRERSIAALSNVRDEETKHGLYMISFMMTAMANPAKAREEALAAPLKGSQLRNEMLMAVAFMPALLGEDTGGGMDEAAITEMCAWVRQHMDAASALCALDALRVQEGHASSEFMHARLETLALIKAGLAAPTTQQPE